MVLSPPLCQTLTGVAVMMVMLVTTLLVSLIMLIKWEVSILLILPFLLFFGFIEATFLSSNLFKVRGYDGNGFKLLHLNLMCDLNSQDERFPGRQLWFLSHAVCVLHFLPLSGPPGWLVHPRGGSGSGRHHLRMVEWLYGTKKDAAGVLQAEGRAEHLC